MLPEIIALHCNSYISVFKHSLTGLQPSSIYVGAFKVKLDAHVKGLKQIVHDDQVRSPSLEPEHSFLLATSDSLLRCVVPLELVHAEELGDQ